MSILSLVVYAFYYKLYQLTLLFEHRQEVGAKDGARQELLDAASQKLINYCLQAKRGGAHDYSVSPHVYLHMRSIP